MPQSRAKKIETDLVIFFTNFCNSSIQVRKEFFVPNTRRPSDRNEVDSAHSLFHNVFLNLLETLCDHAVDRQLKRRQSSSLADRYCTDRAKRRVEAVVRDS